MEKSVQRLINEWKGSLKRLLPEVSSIEATLSGHTGGTYLVTFQAECFEKKLIGWSVEDDAERAIGDAAASLFAQIVAEKSAVLAQERSHFEPDAKVNRAA